MLGMSGRAYRKGPWGGYRQTCMLLVAAEARDARALPHGPLAKIASASRSRSSRLTGEVHDSGGDKRSVSHAPRTPRYWMLPQSSPPR